MFLPKKSLVCSKTIPDQSICILEHLIDLYQILGRKKNVYIWKILNSVEGNKSLNQMLYRVFSISTSSVWHSSRGRTEGRSRTVIQSINYTEWDSSTFVNIGL